MVDSHSFKPRACICFFSFYLILATTPSSSQAAAGIPFPVTISTSFEQNNVDVDLLQLYSNEVKSASTKASKTSTSEKQESAVSALLQKQNQELGKSLKTFATHNIKMHNASLGIDKKQAEEIRASMSQHPIVSPRGSLKYDTWNQMIGYCFGRAAFTHWELLRRGVDPRSIGKIFAVGGLERKGQNFRWDYHMATIVLSTDGDWWVIDALFDRVLKIEDWMKEVSTWSISAKHSRIRFYFSDASKMLPTSGAYSLEKLLIPEYRGYFQDLFDWFHDHPVQASDQFFSGPADSN